MPHGNELDNNLRQLDILSWKYSAVFTGRSNFREISSGGPYIAGLWQN